MNRKKRMTENRITLQLNAGQSPWLHPAVECFFALSIFCGLFGSLLNMTGHMECWYAGLVGVLTIVWIAAVPKRIVSFPAWVFILLSATGTAMLLLWNRGVGSGCMQLANDLFSASEAQQFYAYDRFDVQILTKRDLFGACLLLGILLSVLCACLVHMQSTVATALAALAAALLMAAFGVFPSTALLFWTFGWFAVQGAYCCGHLAWRTAGLLAALVFASALLTSAITGQFLREPDMRLHALSETIRDEVDAHVENPQTPRQLAPENDPDPQLDPEHLQQEDVTGQELAAADQEQIGAKDMDIFTASKAGTIAKSSLPWIILGALLLAGAAALVVHIRRGRRKTAALISEFDTLPVPEAVQSMFAYQLRWLRAAGLKPENIYYADYQPRLQGILPEPLCARYADVVAIWQEASYSNHTMTEAQRSAVRAYVTAVAAYRFQAAGKIRRLQYRYQYFLLSPEGKTT